MHPVKLKSRSVTILCTIRNVLTLLASTVAALLPTVAASHRAVSAGLLADLRLSASVRPPIHAVSCLRAGLDAAAHEKAAGQGSSFTASASCW